MKKLIIFGFDGTIADTSPGILHCFNTIAASMGFQPVGRKSLYGVIGFSLENGLRKLFDMTDDEAEYAIHNYSKLYSMKGKEMFLLYEGMEETLKKLKAEGYKLAIATQKHDMYTRDMLEAYKLTEYFDTICATDVVKETTKADLLRTVCERLGENPSESVFIGDNYVDAQAAEEIGMDFIAVLYGWGFKTRGEAERYNCKGILEKPTDIYSRVSIL
ncbi:MAG: HAD family hydrolase [Ruminococcus sp.]|nr:HAD family hydrolase [Ruminococcus sp.]